MINLDDKSIYKKFDPSNMLTHIRCLPDECLNAWNLGRNFTLPDDYSNINRVIISGMGGSAIGGELAQVLLESKGIPVWVSKDYEPPPFFDTRTLFVASSYSGMTEETLSSFNKALDSPAKKLVITTGGKLKSLAQDNHIPVFSYDYKSPPRAALAYGLFSLLGMFQNLKLLGDLSGDIHEMHLVLKNLQADINEEKPADFNTAKKLAYKLKGRLAVIYGAGITTPVARRWKTQINENSKTWSFAEYLPELNHNAVVGYEYPVELNNNIFVVMLRCSLINKRTALRFEITSEILSRRGIEFQIIDSAGEKPLSQIMALVLFGDYVSYYLALCNEIDPSPVKVIDFLKSELGSK